MTTNKAACTKRDSNFGITCVRASPNEPEDWCRDCIDRRAPGPSPSAPLSETDLNRIRLRYEKYTTVTPADGRMLLREVLRLLR